MARPKAFDVDTALDAALHTFWHHGYERTSLRDLLDVMGISRQSLYDTFGSKHALFLAAFDRYAGRIRGHVTSTLHPPSGLEGVKLLLEQYVDFATEPGSARSCLVANTALEMGGHDEPSRVRALDHIRWTEERLLLCLHRAQQEGHLPSGADVRGIARSLVASLTGLGVLARAGTPRSELMHAMDTTMSMIRTS